MFSASCASPTLSLHLEESMSLEFESFRNPWFERSARYGEGERMGKRLGDVGLGEGDGRGVAPRLKIAWGMTWAEGNSIEI